MKDWVISVWAMAESLNPIKPFKDVKRKTLGICGGTCHVPDIMVVASLIFQFLFWTLHLRAPGADGTLPLDYARLFSSLQDARTEWQWLNNLNNKHCVLDILTVEAGFQKGTDRSGLGWRPRSWFIDGCLLIVPSCDRENNVLPLFSYSNPHTHEDSLWLNLQMSS